MKFLLLSLIVTAFLTSCYSEEGLRNRALHQAESSERINRAQQNTDPLFDELEK
jgi:hypothetical protein